MPFDDTNYRDPPAPPPPPPPRARPVSKRDEAILLALLLVAALVGLVLPISLVSFGDITRAIRGVR